MTTATGNIAAALAKAQRHFAPVVKDKAADTGKYRYSYADLSSILDAVRPALCEAEIALLQPVEASAGEGGVTVTARTVLVHSSGEQLESPPLSVLAADARPQSIGGAATYARRYSLSGFLGIAADDDDDGSAAQGVQAQIAAKPRPAPAHVETKAEPKPATPPHVTAAWDLAKRVYGDAKKAAEPFKVAVQSRIGSRPSSSLTVEEALDVESIIKEGANSPADVPF